MAEAFDQAFARTPRSLAAAAEALLAITVGGDPYLVRIGEIAGIHAGRRITPLPTGVAELCGLVGLRGTVLPVYDLGALLGYARAAAPRWLIVLAAAPVALAFDSFDGHVKQAGAAVLEAGAGDDRPVREIAQSMNLVRPVLALSPVLDRLRRRASHAHRDTERS
jgi:purine-binding chemotaxis protein CheW